MLRDIDKETVDWTPNYDETRKQPRVLPSRFPNLLVNGSSGIAVGMTTNIPPHNLTEVINAVICVMNNPDAELDDIMEHISGPDFPTRGIIMGRAGIRAAYATGRGRIHVRARTEMEEFSQGRTRIIVTELPYQVNRARLLESIAENVKNKRIEGISAMRDESDRDGMRIVIELKRDANAQVVLNRLYTQTQMQTTFAIVMLALVDDQSQPRILSLKQMLDEYITFQREIVRRRTEYDLKKARERAHILEGLRIACDNIDEVIRIIRTSYDNAKDRLMERFELSDIQAQAILEMRLRSLQGLEIERIEKEYAELQEKIKYYLTLLGDEKLLDEVLVSELTEIRDKYGDERRTEIAIIEDEIDIEDLIDEEECVYTLTNAGYIKRQPASTYKAQRRGGRGIMAMTTREEDYVETLFTASTHDYILFFTNHGRVYRKKGYMIPEAGRQARGTNLVNILPIAQGEKVSAMIRMREFSQDEYLVMVTRGGTVKRMRMMELRNIKNVGIRALTLTGEDELISVRDTDGKQKILIATHNGMAICFNETDVRPMGRVAAGVRGIRLRKGDYCVGAARAREGGALLTVTEKGYGKRTEISEYLRGGEDGGVQSRGGYGKKNYIITDKTGKVADVKVVDNFDDVLVISDDGTIIRMAASDISLYGRATQGVRLMRTTGESRVISIARTEKDEEEESSELGTRNSELETEHPDVGAQRSEPETQNEPGEQAELNETSE